MGCANDIFQLQYFAAKGRFDFENIQRRSCYFPVKQGLVEGHFIDDRPTGGVDQNCTALHVLKLVCGDQMKRLLIQRDMDRQPGIKLLPGARYLLMSA